MATNIFPGVYTTIRDESFTMQPLPGAIGFLCMLSEKGPDNEPRMTTSVQDLIKTYGKGNPAKYGQGWYVAKQYLGILGNLYVMRVMPEDSSYANLGLMEVESTVSGENVGVGDGSTAQFELDNGNIISGSYTIYVNGVEQSEGNILSEATGENIGTGDGITGLFTVLNAPIAESEGYTVYVNAISQTEGNTLTDVIGESVGTGDATATVFTLANTGIASTEGYAVYVDGVSQTEGETADYTLDPKTGEITFLSAPSLDAVITADYKYYEEDYTIDPVSGEITFNEGHEPDIDSDITVDYSYYPNNFDLDLETGSLTFNEGHEPAVSAEITADYDYDGDAVGTVFINNVASVASINTAISDSTASIIFYPVGRGSWYNNIAVKLTESAEYAEQFNCYNIDIYQRTVEGEYVISESFLISFDENAVDYSGESLFVEDVLERYSTLLNAKVSDTIDANIDWSQPFTTFINLSEGDDGTLFNTNTGYVDWSSASPLLIQGYSGALTNPKTGEMNNEITDPDCLLFSVIFDAGYPTEVKDSIVDLCDARTDCFAFLDNGDNPTASAAISARENTNTYNNFRVALFEMYTKVYDAYTGKYHWMTPIYHFAKTFAKTERDYDLWWPSAGLTRGIVSGVKDIRYKLVGGYKDQFKLNQLNPIMRWSHGEDCIWGNWSTQRRPSALQNIHVVLTLLYIKRTLEWNLKYYVYDLNDQYTWELIKGNVTSFLGELKSRRALEWFKVNVFATEYDKKINRCQVQVDLKITGAIEVISVTLSVN
jgi:hypothetical protein